MANKTYSMLLNPTLSIGSECIKWKYVDFFFSYDRKSSIYRKFIRKLVSICHQNWTALSITEAIGIQMNKDKETKKLLCVSRCSQNALLWASSSMSMSMSTGKGSTVYSVFNWIERMPNKCQFFQVQKLVFDATENSMCERDQ